MRKEKKYHFIYKTTNLLSGKYYIGMHSTDSLEDGYLGSGTRLRYSINKYGKENHKLEIIEYCDTRDILKNREEEIVTLNEIAKEECMNLCVGGQGGFISLSGCTKGGYISGKLQSNRIKNDNEYRFKVLEKLLIESKKARKNGLCIAPPSFKNKNHSEETKQLIRASKMNQGVSVENSQYGTCWITNGVESKKIFRGDEIPDGWGLGRKMKNT